MIVTEIRQFRVNACTKEQALEIRRDGGGELVFSQDVVNSRPNSKQNALLFNEWPMWAKAMKMLATKEDKGIGDVVRRVIGEETSERFKKWFKKTFNRDCGCDGRLSEWNQKYPLDPAGDVE